jgi:hypothetical protein
MSTENPYEAPVAAVVAPQMPQGYLRDAAYGRKLRALTWLALIYFVLSGLMLVITFKPALLSEGMALMVELLSDIVFIQLVLSLREFLAKRFGCNDVNWQVFAFVVLTIVSFTSSAAIWLDSSNSASLFETLQFLLLVPYGIVAFLFGFKIRKIKERFPYLTGFAWVNMIFGASLALIVLAFVALIIGPLWDILLAMIFLTAAREFRQPGVPQ